MPSEKEARLTVKSTEFSQGGHIPRKYSSCEGEDINPPLEINGYPETTKTLALIMEDPDATQGATDGVFDHWLVWNISPYEPIAENHVPGISGLNSAGKANYTGPCPPTGTHRYFFKVYALDTSLDLPAGTAKKALKEAMQGHIVASGELMGLYKKST